jgi:anti-sigma factor RsiW
MTQHLTPNILSALTDGELPPQQLDAAQQHLATCPQCTAAALAQSMLKTATAKAGHRYIMPAHLGAKLQSHTAKKSPYYFGRSARAAWMATAAAVLVCIGTLFIQHNAQLASNASSQYAALVTEATDQHIATLAAAAPPQVISSDRHTVKPWFQGKLPFSFNLPEPESLPAGTTLEGANLTYFHNQPAALLLYSIGKHRVSVFVIQRTATVSTPPAAHAGFNITGFTTSELEAVAVSDVEASKLNNLMQTIQQVQLK